MTFWIALAAFAASYLGAGVLTMLRVKRTVWEEGWGQQEWASRHEPSDMPPFTRGAKAAVVVGWPAILALEVGAYVYGMFR